jgi:arginine:agmatine antiporter
MTRPTDGKLGLVLATVLVASGMIGSGIYLLPASLGAIGSISMLGWVGAVVGAALLAAVFSWLAILKPGGGGLFAYIGEAFGPGVGFVIGSLYWLPALNLPIALAVTGYLGFFFPALATGVGAIATTLVVIWLFVGFNLVGARFVAHFGGWTLLIGLAPILLVGIGGWFFFHPAVFAASWNVSGKSAIEVIPASTVMAFYAFLSIENAAVVAPLLANPERDVMRASFAGLALATIVYLAASAAIMGILPASELAKSTAPFADAARPIVGASIAGLVAICAMLRAGGTFGGAILMSAETAESSAVLGQVVPGRPARRADLPPKLSLIVIGLIMTLTEFASASPSLGRQFAIVADITVVLCVVAYLAACLALLKFSAAARPDQRWMARAIAIAGAVFCCAIIAASEPKLLIWSAGAVGIATAVWVGLRWRRRLQPA